MNDKETQQAMIDGFDLLCTWARNIAILPLEEWDQALNRAETLGPLLSPTLYREYLYSEKAKILRRVLAAAIRLKSAVQEAQPVIQSAVYAIGSGASE